MTAEFPQNGPANGPSVESVETLQRQLTEAQVALQACQARAVAAEAERATAVGRALSLEEQVIGLGQLVVDQRRELRTAAVERRLLDAERGHYKGLAAAAAERLEVSESRVAELSRLRDLDSLTGFYNKAAYDRALPRAEEDPEIEILFIDANNFGVINKLAEFGDVAGDQEIAAVAEAIREAGRRFNVSDRMMFRRGGDEFVLFVRRGLVEYFDRLPGTTDYVNLGQMSRAEAIIRAAQASYGVRPFAGTLIQTGEYATAQVSISGSAGNTFDEARVAAQAAKAADKAAIRQQMAGPGDADDKDES